MAPSAKKRGPAAGQSGDAASSQPSKRRKKEPRPPADGDGDDDGVIDDEEPTDALIKNAMSKNYPGVMVLKTNKMNENAQLL